MEFTGERVIPGRTDPDLFNEHVARYRFAEALVGGQAVLDAGCGVGYGADLLARKARVVYALDNAPGAVAHGRGLYAESGVRFVAGSCSALPFNDASLDVIAAFEVIEHLEDWQGLLSEARRVLRPDGQLLVSTPNRPYYEKTRTEPNPYHVHEFDYSEFKQALGEFFAHTTIFFENHSAAITFRADRMQGVRTALDGGDPDPEESHFFLAVCSARPQYGAPAFVYVPTSGNMLLERERHIASLRGWLDEATRSLEDLARRNQEEQVRAQEAVDRLEAELAEKTSWAEQVDRDIESVRADHARLEAEFKERSEWAQSLQTEYDRTLANYRNLEKEYGNTQGELQGAIAKIDELEQRVIERTDWARSLEARLQKIRDSPAYKLAKTFGLAPKLDG